jgi:hypothetical protein
VAKAKLAPFTINDQRTTLHLNRQIPKDTPTQQIISRMRESYEHGRVSRRQLIQGLTAVAATGYAATASASTFQGIAPQPHRDPSYLSGTSRNANQILGSTELISSGPKKFFRA